MELRSAHRGSLPPRSGRRKALIGLNVLLSLALVAVVSGAGYVQYRYGQFQRVTIQALNDDPGEAMNVLLVGSDSRENLAEEADAFGTTEDAAGQRADTIMVAHIDPRAGKISVLSIPRDTWVTNATTGTKSKINDAFLDGPNGLVQTISDTFGIPIDHYAQVDFNGFRGVIDAVGGVDVPFPTPARDRETGLNVTEAGCRRLGGEEALAYARSRHYSAQINGRWREDVTQDLGRIKRQQDFVRRAADEVVSSARNPLTLNSIIGNAVPNVTLDDGLTAGDITRVANAYRSLDVGAIDMQTIPNTVGTAQGLSVVLINEDEIGAAVERFLNGGPVEAVGPPAAEDATADDPSAQESTTTTEAPITTTTTASPYLPTGTC